MRAHVHAKPIGANGASRTPIALRSAPKAGSLLWALALGVTLAACDTGTGVRTGTVVGLVTLSDGVSTFPGARVELVDDARVQTMTLADGSYRLEGVPVGDQRLRASRGVFSVEFGVTVEVDREVQVPAQNMTSDKPLGYVAGVYDRIQEHFPGGVESVAIARTQLSEPAVTAEYAMIFVNCGSGVPTDSATIENLRDWIEGGGVLYLSDLEFPLLRELFPDRVGDWSFGASGNTTAEVLDPILAASVGDSIQIRFNLGGWAAASGLAESASPILEGARPGLTDPGAIAFSFSHGRGEVVFTSYHHSGTLNEDQRAVLLHYVTWFGGNGVQGAAPARARVDPPSEDRALAEAHRRHAEALFPGAH